MAKPQIDDQHVIDELTAACNSLGKLDENDGTYMKDRDCKACLKEITRFLSSDSNKFVARCTLGSLNIIKADLIPLMIQYCDYYEGDPELFTLVLRLATNLTSSIQILFDSKEEKPESEDQGLRNKLLHYLYRYKEAFANDERIWLTLNTHLKKNTDDEVTFERLIILIRNILHIPVDATADLGVHDQFDAHEMCLYRMDKSKMLDTIITTASETQKGTEYCFHITEIVYLILREQNPETIAKAKPFTFRNKLDDNDIDKRRLAELSARDRREKERADLASRQPRFRNSAFVVQNFRSISDQPILSRSATISRENLRFNDKKQELRKAKNRRPLSSDTAMSISDKSHKLSEASFGLKVFCKKFVDMIYNNYMLQIKHNLIQKKAQDNDETYYFWAIQFFTAFTRHYHLKIDNISETLSTSTLHFIQMLISSYQDKIKVEKKDFQDVSKRLHLALRAYREILYLIKAVKGDSNFTKTVDTIQRNIFTESEYCTLMVTLFQQYNEPKHSLHYLSDLIQTNYIFVELLEEYSQTHHPIDGEDNDFEPTQKSAKKRKRKADFRTAHFMTRYCCPDVIRAHLTTLKNFRTNEDLTNEAILKLFERIFYDCKNEVILMQVSVFKCILDIMSYHSNMPGYERFVTLGKDLIEKFGSMANKRRWMYQEILFWKTTGDVLEIENAVDPPPPQPIISEEDTARVVAEEDDDEFLAHLFDEPPIAQQQVDDELPEELPAGTIADLMAELGESSDSDDHDSENNSVRGNDNENPPDGELISQPELEAEFPVNDLPDFSESSDA